MSDPTTSERLAIALITARRAKARAAGKVWRLPILRWRYGLPIADRFTIIPSDLRVADPSFVVEVAQGQFNLAGRIATLDRGASSPFAIRPPSIQWQRELHGFGWLRHMRVADSDEAQQLAVHLTMSWISSQKARRGPPWAPEVLARRVTSWIANVPLLLHDVPQDVYETITDSLGEQLIELSARWRESGHDVHRLQALIALVQAMLCVSGHDDEVESAKDILGHELRQQIMPDGGHISRNPSLLIELLLDCLPLRQCFVARDLPPPRELQDAIDGMMSMLRLLRHGDGSLARFNGMGEAPVGELATVMAYDQVPATLSALPGSPLLARHVKYARLHANGTVIVIDAGGPPPWDVAGQAHAGCLSFELSSGRVPVFINCGAPRQAFDNTLAAARATASHNTLTIDGKSSSRMINSSSLKALAGGFPISDPKTVTASIGEDDSGQSFSGTHDGFWRRFGMIHRRDISLSHDGLTITGNDSLGALKKGLRLPKDAPFAVHFHLHQAIQCELEDPDPSGHSGCRAILTLPDGDAWRFSSQHLPLSVEPSVDYACALGPHAGLQIVLRGASFGESEAGWTISRIQADAD